jgi:hypothetical protein
MNKALPRFVALGALAASTAFASFQPDIVSADAQWVLHADLDALRSSILGKELVDAAAKMQSEHQSASMNVQIDVAKLLTTVGSITAYGSKFSKNPNELNGTLVVEGTADLRKIAEGYIAQATVSNPNVVVQIPDFPIEAYTVGGADGVVVAFPAQPIVLVSKSKEQILHARDVYAGKSASLKGSKSTLAGLLKAQRNPFLRAASVVPSAEMFPEGAPQARLLQMTDSAAISLGEEDATAFLHLELVAASDANADKLTKIVQGLAAMASLAESKDQQLTAFLQSIAVKRADRNVTVDLSYPSAKLIEMSRSLRDSDRGKVEKSGKSAPTPEGKVIATWTADKDLGNAAVSAETLVYHSIENVTLTQGCTLVLQGGRSDGEHARLDVVEIVPSGGGAPLKFEAEKMVLKGYQPENAPAASGGKVIMAKGNRSTARFQFPAGDGSYTIRVRYVDENDGRSEFSLSVLTPEVEAN